METIANVKMNVEGMEKLIFTNVHFNMNVGLENDNERERKKAIYSLWDGTEDLSDSAVLGRSCSNKL